MNIPTIPVALACTLLFAGCVPLNKVAVEGTFGGLHQTSSNPGSTNEVLHILVVHGMGNHSPGYSAPLQQAIESKLKLRKTSEEYVAGVPSGFLRESTYHNPKGLDLRVHELTWTPATEFIKNASFGSDLNAGVGRELFNDLLKTRLIDLSFSDAILYAGSYRPAIQRPVRFAIEHVLGQVQGSDRVVLVTYSLGSYIVFDTWDQMRREQSAGEVLAGSLDVLKLREHTTEMFMFANQLPLLSLSSISAPPGSPLPAKEGAMIAPAPSSNPLRSFIESGAASINRESSRATKPSPLQVVAFSDPNDLLSYKLNQEDVGASQLSNVTMTVENWSILGIFANPLKAHTGWDADPRAINLLIEGSQAK